MVRFYFPERVEELGVEGLEPGDFRCVNRGTACDKEMTTAT